MRILGAGRCCCSFSSAARSGARERRRARRSDRELLRDAFERTLHAPGVRSVELRVHRGGQLVSRRAFDVAYRRDAEGARSLLRFTAPNYLRGHALLVLETRRTAPATRGSTRPRSGGRGASAPRTRRDSFYGSDLSFEELEHQRFEHFVAAPARADDDDAGAAVHRRSRPCRSASRSTGGSSCGSIGRATASRAWTSTAAPIRSRTSDCASRSTTSSRKRASCASSHMRIEQIGRDAWTDVETSRMEIEPGDPGGGVLGVAAGTRGRGSLRAGDATRSRRRRRRDRPLAAPARSTARATRTRARSSSRSRRPPATPSCASRRAADARSRCSAQARAGSSPSIAARASSTPSS